MASSTAWRETTMETSIQSLLDKKGHTVYSIDAHQTVYEAISMMDARNVGALIVKEADRVVGIITERDYTRKVILKGRASKETAVETIMSRDLVIIEPKRSVKEALAIMTEKRCRHLPVFQDAQLLGILSIGDLVKEIIAGQEFQIQLLEDYITAR
jgi:CBS domain-containing protein